MSPYNSFVVSLPHSFRRCLHCARSLNDIADFLHDNNGNGPMVGQIGGGGQGKGAGGGGGGGGVTPHWAI